MLKRYVQVPKLVERVQPPSGGCVLKPRLAVIPLKLGFQPPSGGCVLKQLDFYFDSGLSVPAAFGRLCVETGHAVDWGKDVQPAAFGRLCVETQTANDQTICCQPSRLRAAVC